MPISRTNHGQPFQGSWPVAPVLILSASVVFATTAYSASSGPILSEAQADPTAVSDAQGEFLELGNPGADTLRLDSLRIDAESQTLVLTRVVIGPEDCLLICRDSLPAENGGMACGRQWAGLSLANGRSLAVALSWNGARKEFALPASRPGISWENTWDASASYGTFAPSMAGWTGADSATPGTRNSRSAIRPEHDLGIVDVTWSAGPVGADLAVQGSAGSEGFLEVRVANRGTGSPPLSTLTLRLDADWDGEPESLLDSVPVSLPAAGEAVLRFGAGAGVRGIVHARLGRDGDPSDDLFILPVEPGRPLAITEWRPAPIPGEPEWVEIRNRTADSGGIGRRLDLSRAAFNGLALGSKAGVLDPGEFLVLTESLDRFRGRYGAIKARVLQPSGWRALRNSGDTLVLSLAGLAVDSVAYPAVSLAQARAASAGTPGFAGPGEPGGAVAAEAEGWSLSGKVAGDGRTIEVEVRIAPGGTYGLRVFDLEGNQVRDLGSGGQGRSLHGWDGRGDGGAPLIPGPYILCLAREGRPPRRAAVIVMASP